MRPRLALAALAALTLAACSEPGVAPNDPLARAPTLQMTHLGDPISEDLCGGFSPCDAFDYGRVGVPTGAAGICFLPPTVDNHLSDPACSAPNRPGLDGLFQLAWCRVEYTDPEEPPTLVAGSCQDQADWKDLVEDDGFYSASVRWRRSDADDGDILRVYVVRGEQAFAHRDLIIDPNLTTPADDYVHAIGYGNEPIKVRINEDFSCIKFDTQGDTPENAATCLIAGATTVPFETGELVTTFSFPDGNPTFLADFEVSECLTLGFDIDPTTGMAEGNALVDVPLADCKISLSSEELDALSVPGQIVVDFTDERWEAGEPFENARVNVLQYDEDGVGALPPSSPQGWFGAASSSSAALRWLDRGLDLLADLFLPEPLYARIGGWDFTRMSDFQVSVMPVMDGASGVICSAEEPYCRDLGVFESGGTASVSVQVSAPTDDGPTAYPANHVDVADTRLHFFPQSGSVSCPGGSGQSGAYGRGCVEPGDPDASTDPPSTWDHVVVVTGTDGTGTVDWTLADGDNTLLVSGCGVARPGNEPDPPAEPGSDRVWGTLGECTDREVAAGDASAFSNGPADGLTPFEPVDTENEVAIYGRPLEFRAATCPAISVDGMKDDAFGGSEWEVCAEKTIFTAPLKGPKVEDNAALYTYSDGDALYIGVEVDTNELGGKIFINLAESVAAGDGVEAAGDDILLIDFDDPMSGFDWHLTEACTGNNSASLCGDPDGPGDGSFAVYAEAREGGAGQGTVFYEFVRPLGSPNSAGATKEDLGAAFGDEIALKLTVTQGQGGGKGGFVYPDPQGSSTEFHVFTIE